MSVTAIIPCHNNERWIAAALDSVAAQSAPVHDVIVLADASTDRSAQIAAAHPLRPRLESTSFRNAAATRNYGAALARTRWIAFLDADDWWSIDHLRTALDLLESSSTDVAYFGHFVEHWGEAGLHHHPPALPGAPRAGLSAPEFYRAFLGPNPGWPTSGMVLSADRFRAVGGFDVTQVRRHDTEMLARVIHGHTWSYNPQEVFFYRKAVQDSISSDRAACSYYRLRADLKIVGLYGPAAGQAHLRRKAEEALSLTLTSARPDLFRETYVLGRPYLRGAKRLFYTGARMAPGAFRSCLSLVHARARSRTDTPAPAAAPARAADAVKPSSARAH